MLKGYPKIILLNGPSSSGKSTIAGKLDLMITRSSGIGYKVISIDDFLEMNCNEPIYEDDVFDIMPDMCKQIERAFQNGFGVIIDHVMTSRRIYDMISCLDKDMFIVKVTCSQKVLVEREKKRGNRCIGSAMASLEYLFPQEGYDLIVDTSNGNASACAESILQAIQSKHKIG